MTDWFKIITICAQNMPCVYERKRLRRRHSSIARHQRSTGQTAPTRPSDIFLVHVDNSC